MISALHALLEIGGHQSLFFRAKLSSNESTVVPTAILSDRGHPRFLDFNFTITIGYLWNGLRLGLNYRRFFRIHKCFRVYHFRAFGISGVHTHQIIRRREFYLFTISTYFFLISKSNATRIRYHHHQTTSCLRFKEIQNFVS